MEFWQHKLEQYCQVLNERLDQARQWKADMRRWAGQIHKTPTSELESAFFTVDLEDPERVFDNTFMEEFREAHKMVISFYSVKPNH